LFLAIATRRRGRLQPTTPHLLAQLAFDAFQAALHGTEVRVESILLAPRPLQHNQLQQQYDDADSQHRVQHIVTHAPP